MQFIRWWRNDNSNSRELSTEAKHLLKTINELADERDRLTKDLQHALETIKTLQDKLAEYDFLLKRARVRITQLRTTNSRPRGDAAKRPPSDPWIHHIWFCSSKSSELLGQTEHDWKSGHPQRALYRLSTILSTRNLTLADHLMCKLLMAAIFHYTQNYNESNQLLESVLETTHGQLVRDYSNTMELTGIARFIQGKNMAANENWNEAFWSFTKALYTPGYHTMAQKLQSEAMNKLESSMANDTWAPTMHALAHHQSTSTFSI
ncbi:hypothetical protein MPDQ_000633 [Monascus purpureus]|uniref:Uncharacterized protein n=1 Tax=Monascus purpureus TaxID=5098 RepID=A0A507QTK7_MONPU|nr:hypothetical protein MPDQ_000633 [Monascus purpureus]BDD55144.1 hypothetical protein MAP00_000692 [Monascus purpureus]